MDTEGHITRTQRQAERRTLAKALGIVVAPLLAAAFLAWMVMQDSAARLDAVQVQMRLIAASDEASQIVSELQRERGRSSGFLSSGGTEFGPELAIQRAATDVVLSAGNGVGALVDLGATGRDDIDADLDLRVAADRASQLVSRLPDIRGQVDALTLDRPGMMAFYTEIIDALLTITDLTTLASTATPGERLGVLDALLQQAIEFAGQERAAGSSALTADTPSERILTNLSRLEARQEVLLERFRRLAPADLVEELDGVLDSPAARARDSMRSVFETRTKILPAAGNAWFATTTDVIDQLAALSSTIRSAQQTEIADARAAIQARHLTALTVATIALVVSLGFAIWQSRAFVRPIRNLAISLRRLADGHEKIEVEGTDRDDLVGLLGRSVARLVALGSERFEDLLSHAPIATSIENLDGTKIRHNPAMARFLNVEPEFLKERHLADFMSKEDRTRAEGERDAFLEGGQDTHQLELMFHRPDGSIVWGNMTRIFVRGTGSMSDFVIMQVLDVTEAKQIEIAKTNFVSTVSHELRTPLTSVSSAVGMLHGQARDGGDQMQLRLLDIASTNCRRLLTLINDLLDVDRLSQGGVTLSMEREDIGLIVEGALSELEPYARDLGVTIRFTRPDRAYFSRTDKDRVTQVLANLISNAAKFSPAGSQVDLKLDHADTDMIRVSVTDRGPGISDAFASQIFGRFKQQDGSISRSHGGSGIGLHISHGLIEQLGGDIGFHNNEGGGATFWFTLPSMGEIDRTGTHRRRAAPNRNLPHVLHVEDDPNFAELLHNVLDGRAELTHARSFAAGKACLASDAYDLVLLDWELPDGSGLDLLDDPALSSSSIPVIGLSANADAIRPARAELNILKSKMSLEEIGEIILRVIGRRAQTRAETEMRKTG
ncbi:nitrate- and nitrite sensing domain-containing protein [Maribius pontilimi]|uniref:histidine kinase n=1 Tax=Palleronia pontilimi TaxID=1964209 RepID=A0A934I900_9RHOB|nr:nitrate- and nitrite sensing domain-containing protein [Palleronia pontilimi]MBJ3761286.1 nitrate- and nitrite sensing domain-containing protein [Palleronia pontilimi]